jgi:hypothetical protein
VGQHSDHAQRLRLVSGQCASITPAAWRPATLMKTPLVSQSSAGAAVWIWGRAPEVVLGRIHVLATAEMGEDLSGAVTHTA